ncbi:MAG: hypothetical protein DME90_07055 [Verrucomicrobia bacterium]|nr:MAG: hypothetical protein DME90_07055 [Verrucomicrobiota bacterium]
MTPRVERHPRTAPAKFIIAQQGALIAAIVIAVAVVYLPALQGDFVWDDFLLITGNPLLQDFSGLLEIWSANCKCVARLAIVEAPEHSRRVAGWLDLRDSSDSRGVGGVDFRVKEFARHVLRAVVGPLFP